ncbi:TPA: hypothetical protein N0F65_004856 [Lagenidium giganteum]|uniref:Retrotransposon gag domain-containing protein n=1 Tax=Lagenidium giganteum TaxID=4803 RepID=A0AAV2Z552_9STRA|nr:TPA: hypothetical protein N0F65_004856 [Lagenidium giganteum]
MAKVVGDEAVKAIMRNLPPNEQVAVARRYIDSEVEQEMAHATSRPTPPAPRQTVKIDISNYSGYPKESILRWFVELDTAIGARRLDEAAMQTLASFKLELRAAFEPLENEFRTRLQFLSLRQGTQDMHGYVQRARMLLASILADPVDQQTQLAVFIAGMRDGPVKNYLLRSNPRNLEEAIQLASSEEFGRKVSNLPVYNGGKSGGGGGGGPEKWISAPHALVQVGSSVSASDVRTQVTWLRSVARPRQRRSRRRNGSLVVASAGIAAPMEMVLLEGRRSW